MSSLPVIAHVASGLIFMVKHWTTTRKWERFTVMLRSVVFYNSQRKTHTHGSTQYQARQIWHHRGLWFSRHWRLPQPKHMTAHSYIKTPVVYERVCVFWWGIFEFGKADSSIHFSVHMLLWWMSVSLSFFSFDCDCLSLTFTLHMLCASFIVTFKSSQTNTLLVTSQPFCSTKHQEK